MTMNRLALIIALILTGCSTGGEVFHGADGDSDGGRDGDADVDGDGDGDGDGDADGECTPGCSGGECLSGDWATICAGGFKMGSPSSEFDERDLAMTSSGMETQHDVTLTRHFEISATEVTQAEFETLMGYNPSNFSSCGGDCPVEQITWHEAAAYCNALSEEASLGQCYECAGSGAGVACSASAAHPSPYDCPGYRLPTEAEWEYAARAGTITATYNGDLDAKLEASATLDPIAWYGFNSGVTYAGADDWTTCVPCGTHPVHGLRANPWGLYDILGNVAEWVHDNYREDLGNAAATDPLSSDGERPPFIRGGTYRSAPLEARAAFRRPLPADFRYLSIGMRPVRSLL